MSDQSESTKENKEKLYRELCNLVSGNLQEGEITIEDLVKKFKEWEDVRNDTIRTVGNVAQGIKQTNSESVPIQALCKVGSITGKIATFFGPVSAVVGAGTSIAFDTCHAFCSKRKIEDMEKISDRVLRAIDRDNEVTAELFDLMKKVQRISTRMNTAVGKFHTATIAGVFDNVPSLRSFVNRARRISDVRNLKGLLDFLNVLREEAEVLISDPELFGSLLALVIYNSYVLELCVTIPEILCNAGILFMGGAQIGMAGNVMAASNVLGIITDVACIISSVRSYNEYPKMAKQLLKVKKELEDGKQKLQGMKKEFEKKETK